MSVYFSMSILDQFVIHWDASGVFLKLRSFEKWINMHSSGS